MADQETEWGSLAASEEEGKAVIDRAYGWSIAIDGTVAGLVAGDQGYNFTHIVIPQDHLAALVEDFEGSQVKELKAENAKLKEQLGLLNASVSERMKAMGMIPIEDLLNKPPTPFSLHAGVHTYEDFKEWVSRKHEEYLHLRMAYETGKRDKDDDLFEWIFSHNAAFASIAQQFAHVFENENSADPEDEADQAPSP